MIYNKCQIVGANNNKLTVTLEIKKRNNHNLIAIVQINKEYILKGKSVEFYNQLTNEKNYVYINEASIQLGHDQNNQVIYEYHLTDWYYSEILLTKETLLKFTTLMATEMIEDTETKQIVTSRINTNQEEIKYISIERNAIYDNSNLRIKGYQIFQNKDLNQLQLPTFLTSYLKLTNTQFKEPYCYLYEGENSSYFRYNSCLKNSSESDNLDIKVSLNLSVTKYKQIYLANKQFIDTNINTVLTSGECRNYAYKYELLLDYIVSNYRSTNDICAQHNLRTEVNQLMKIVRSNHSSWEFQVSNAKNTQLIVLLLLLYKEDAIDSYYKYKFPHVLVEKIRQEQMYSIANNLTKLRNHYAHNNKYVNNNTNILLELMDELCYLVFMSTLGIKIDKSSNSSSLSTINYVALDPNYNSEIKVNEILINKFYKKQSEINVGLKNNTIYLDENLLQYKYYYDLQPGNMSECINKLKDFTDITIDIQVSNIIYANNTTNNISLYPCIKGLNYIKNQLRFDQYIYFMMKLSAASKGNKSKRLKREKEKLISKFGIDSFKLSKLFIKYIRSFNTIYDYAMSVHGIDKTLTDELLINGSKSNNNIKEHIVYIQLLNSYYDKRK